MSAVRSRNVHVEKAVRMLIDLVDRLAEGQSLGPPTSRATKAIFDNHVKSQGGSVRLAYAFLTAYSIIDLEWDFNSVPTGIRGKYGDKLLANEQISAKKSVNQGCTNISSLRQTSEKTASYFQPQTLYRLWNGCLLTLQ
jgi:hypothetical protein